MAWIDADIAFDNPHWVSDTLRLLSSGEYDVVQNFSHCLDLDAAENAMNVFSGFGFQYAHGRPYSKGGEGVARMWHPGYSWSCTRSAYTRMGGLYDWGILGSGDHHLSLSWIGHSQKSVNENVSDGYKASLAKLEKDCKGFRIGYTPGVIRHFYHGDKKGRQYDTRWKVLVKYQYDPYTHVTKNKDGLLIPTAECPQGLIDDIYKYFSARNEDQKYQDGSMKMHSLKI